MPGVVIHAESVDEDVNRGAVLAAQRGFKVAQVSVLLNNLGVLQTSLLRRRVQFRRNVDLQQFFAAGVAEHADHSVIHFDKAALRCAEEKAFLNIVEEFAIPPLGLAAVGNVLEYVNGLQTLVDRPTTPR